MSENISTLQENRYSYIPKLPKGISGKMESIKINFGKSTEAFADRAELKQMFSNTYGQPTATFSNESSNAKTDPLTVGVILSGGQAPGGHNVIAGLFDGLKKVNKDSKLIGFLGGPSGILDNKYIDITDEYLAEFRNTGGVDIIGSGRTKLETEEQFETCAQVMKKLGVTSLVVIGGDDSNTNAALLAEYFKSKDISIQVIGVPKTIDGDLKTREIPISFGFDTACKVYSELVGNIARDSNSAKKYWHFIKLMGRSASHIALETALQTHPNICLIGEEVDKKQQTLDNIVGNIVDVILKRSNNGCDYGIALIPEGLIEFIPEMKALIAELNDILAENEKHFSTLSGFTEQSEFINHKLSRDTSYTFSSLPWDIQRQLLMDRDPHGNVQVSRIETEKLLIELVESKLKELKNKGEFKGKFSAQSHFFGYEGRCAAPSNFDADYTYSLGVAAVLLINAGLTGYMSSIQNLLSSSDDWIAGGIPVTMMMNLEQRHGKKKPVIRKALVELEGAPFKEFKARKKEWAINTRFRYPGPIQYFGPDSVCDAITITLKLEQENIN